MRRRSTEGALVMRFLANGGELSQAAERFGSISDEGKHVGLPTRSPGGLWLGTLNRQELSLYLTRLTPTGATPARMLGMIFDGVTRQWVALDKLVWDASTQQLSGYHASIQGTPERHYVVTLTGDDFVGTCIQEGVASSWHAQRSWLEGMWNSTSPLGTLVLSYVGRWEAPLPAGSSDNWRGKYFQDNRWHLLDSVTVQHDTITITARQHLNDPIKLAATLLRDTWHGAEGSTGGPWQATRVTDDILISGEVSGSPAN